MALQDFSIDTSGTPEQLQRRQSLADALLKQGTDSSPAAGGRNGGLITGLNRGLAALLGGYESGRIDREARAGRESANQAFNGAGSPLTASDSGSGFEPMGTADPIGKPHAANGGDRFMENGGRALPADTSGKIYNNDEPSPLDPPSGQDRKLMAMTLLGEAGNQGPLGMQAVGSTIRNRAVDGGYGGDTPSQVVTAKNQFEPFNTDAGRQRMAAALADPKQAAAADDAIDRVYGTGKYVANGPDDPTEGKTMFYSPSAQAGLGRPAPSWAQGEGQKIGGHVFYDDNSNGPAVSPKNVQLAQALMPESAAPSDLPRAITQGPQVAQNGGAPTGDVRSWAIGIINNPYSSAAQKQVATGMLQKAMTPKEDSWSSAGNGYIMNSRTGQTKRAYEAEEKKPASVQEYEYYKSTLPPGESAMPYQAWSVQKARAGATNVTTTVGGENKGLDEARKLDAETVRKNQNDALPALDDADKNFQIMQDAIDRNGGKLPTGGILGKMGLDAQRTAGFIRDNWGIDLGGDPTTTTSLETFNKGGIKASGDMAKAIGGNRVLKVEFENAIRANPGLETSDGGNKYLLDLNRNSIAIKRDYYQSQEDYWRENNHSLDGFQKKWNAEAKANPRPLSTFSVTPPINNGDGSQFIKLPSTAQGGYSWYRKGQDGLSPVADQDATKRLEDQAKPLKAAEAAPAEKSIGGKTYVKQGNNWFEKGTQ
jgi:spore germination cell wall hydrolase CwlJ-like protein